MPVIEIRQVSKSFGRRPAVSDISMKLEGGRIYALAGPGGSGKSTLLRIVMGLVAPSRGDVLLNGVAVASEPARDQIARIGFLPQNPRLYRSLTVGEYLRFTARIPYGRELARGRIRSLLKRFKLCDQEDRSLGALSAATHKKVALISTLIHDPPILIQDDPLSGLDAWSAANAGDALARCRDRGGLALVATPTLDGAEMLADRVFVLGRGSIREEGDLWKAPASCQYFERTRQGAK